MPRVPWCSESAAGHAGQLVEPDHLVLVEPVGIFVLLGDQRIDDISPGLVAETRPVTAFAAEIGVGLAECQQLGTRLEFLVRQ